MQEFFAANEANYTKMGAPKEFLTRPFSVIRFIGG